MKSDKTQGLEIMKIGEKPSFSLSFFCLLDWVCLMESCQEEQRIVNGTGFKLFKKQ